jgi:uncharacterized membrane protein
LLALNIESVSKQTFEKNYEIVKKADEKEKTQDKLQNQIIDKLIAEEKRENAKREAEKRERERIEAEKRKEQARIAEQKEKEKKVRTVCLWIMGIFIALAVIFAIWGTEGLGVVGGIVGFFAFFGFIGWIQNATKR